MNWNYRIVKIPNKEELIIKHKLERYYYEIMEVYYDENNEPYAFGSSSKIAENLNDIVEYAKLQYGAIEKDIVVVDESLKFLYYEKQ